MHWVYAIEGSDGDIYVGETTRLYRRFNEHETGRGGQNTSRMNIQKLRGIYSVGNNNSFLKYKDDLLKGEYNWKCSHYWGSDEDKESACLIENNITKQYISRIQDIAQQFNIRGGCLTTTDRVKNFIFSDECKHFIADRPLCYCGSPAEVNLTKDKGKIYFNCPLSKPSNWDNFYSFSEIPEKCNFYQEFKAYSESKEKHDDARKKQYEWWVSKLPKHGDKCIKCRLDIYKPIWSAGKRFSCCEQCFSTHYETLKLEYSRKPRDLSQFFTPV
jgi:predicted GIY-YIG superfamily endonuclease